MAARKAKVEEVTANEVVAPEAQTLTKTSVKKQSGLSIDVLDVTGKASGKVALPAEIFGVEVNQPLMAQAVRVYLANQRSGTARTKSRGEVTGSTRKIYRQKGTGRARHGGITAPIFVGGGVAHGPKVQDHSLSLPKKMRRLALFSALSYKLQNNAVKVIEGLEALEPKTKVFAKTLDTIVVDKKKKVLLVLPGKTETVERASRNIEGVTYVSANQLNTYDVLNTKTLIFAQNGLETLKTTFIKESK